MLLKQQKILLLLIIVFGLLIVGYFSYYVFPFLENESIIISHTPLKASLPSIKLIEPSSNSLKQSINPEFSIKPIKLSASEQKYLQLMQDYQILQMEQRIIQSKQAIMEAKLRIAAAEVKLKEYQNLLHNKKTLTTTVATQDNNLFEDSFYEHVEKTRRNNLELSQLVESLTKYSYSVDKLTLPEAKGQSFNGFTSSEEKILALNPKSYTIQLISDDHLNHLLQFMQQLSLPGTSYYFHRLHNKHNWYVLIYGEYLSEQQAFQAINQMPSSIRDLRPFVIKIGVVQAQIKKSCNRSVG